MIKFLAVSIALFTLIPQWLYCQTPQWHWAKGFGGDYVDKANALVTDADGNVYMAGEFYSSSITFGSTTLYNTGVSDIFIVKFDSSGQVIWANSFQGSAGSNNKTTAVTVDSHGNVIITGVFESPSLYYNGYAVNNTCLTDLFVAKISPSSGLIWMKAAVGPAFDGSRCICTDQNDNIFIAGAFDSYVLSMDDIVLDKKGNGNPCTNAFIFMLDENGDAIWGTNFGEDSDDGIIINAIKVKPDGNIVFCGNFTTPRMGIGQDTIFNLDTIPPSMCWDAFVIEMTPDFVYNEVFHIAGPDEDYIYDMDVDKDGNVVFTGYFNSNPLIIGLDTMSYIPPNIDMFTVYISYSGDFLWARSIGNDPILADYNNCVFDSKGNVFFTGQYWGDTLFIANDTLVGHTFDDFLLLKYTSEGEIEYCLGAGDEGFDEPRALTIDNEDNIYMAGSYTSSVLVIGNDSLVNVGANDCFLAKFSEYKRQDLLPENFVIFPNPSDGYITINPGSDFIQGYNLEVTNMVGQRIYYMQADDRQLQELFLPFASGVYCVTIYNQLMRKSAKIIIE